MDSVVQFYSVSASCVTYIPARNIWMVQFFVISSNELAFTNVYFYFFMFYMLFYIEGSDLHFETVLNRDVSSI